MCHPIDLHLPPMIAQINFNPLMLPWSQGLFELSHAGFMLFLSYALQGLSSGIVTSAHKTGFFGGRAAK